MKRILSVILMLSILLSSSVCFNTFAEETIIYSDSFENGLEDWYLSGGETLANGRIVKLSEEKASDGNKSVYVYDENDSNYAGISKLKVYPDPLKKYIVSADLFVLQNTIRLDVKGYDSSGNELFVKRLSSSKTNEWETSSIEITSIPGLSYIRIYLLTESAGGGEGYIDNIKVTESGELTEEEKQGSHLFSELNSKIKNAVPGDVIEIEDGIYYNTVVLFDGEGTEEKPITVKAKNPGKVIFKGYSAVKMGGEYLTLEGLVFEECTYSPRIVYTKKDSKYCVLKDLVILNSKGSTWVGMYGQYHTVTGCYFRGKDTGGLMVEVLREDSTPNYVTIENCYFGDYKSGSGNGYETVRIGTSSNYDSGSYSIVRNCFFEECNGEVEIISVKSGNNKIYNNTFYNCDGAVYSRHGNNNDFSGNLFICEQQTSRDTGIVIYGDNHKVSNNYFYNLPRTSAAVVLKHGHNNPGYIGYLQPVTNIDLSNNTVLGCDLGFKIGEYSPSASDKSNCTDAPQGSASDNVLLSYKGVLPQIKRGDTNDGIAYNNNYVWGKAIGYDGSLPEGILYNALDYEISDGFLTFENNAGADISEVKKAPVNPYEIITDWIREKYYDSSIFKFTPVSGDPFNTSFDVKNILTADNSINIMLNGLRQSFTKKPYIKNDEIMVPITELFQKTGGTVTVTGNTVKAKKGDITLTFTKNSSTVTRNKRTKEASASVDYQNGEFFIPLGFTIENLSGYYSFLSDENASLITMNISAAEEAGEEFSPALEDGSEENPYLINNYNDFVNVFGSGGDTALLSSHFKQTCDIILPDNYKPLVQQGETFFTGVYDGNGYSIHINTEDEEKEGDSFGGVFYASKGTIKNLTVSGKISVPNANYVGGIVGYNFGKIENCINKAVVEGKNYVGGIAGAALNEISYSANYGDITANGSYAGGIAGSFKDSAEIKASLNAGKVFAVNGAGGIIGADALISSDAIVKISDCYNTGLLTADAGCGSAAGSIGTASTYNYQFILDSFYDVANPAADVVGNVSDEDVLAVSNSYVLNPSGSLLYGKSINEAGLNSLPDGFSVLVWGIISGDYPYIQFIEKNEDNSYKNEYEGPSVSETFIRFDSFKDIKRVDNLFGLDYDNFVISAAKYTASADVDEAELEYGFFASKENNGSDLTADDSKKFISESADSGLYAVKLCNIPDILSLRPYALYNGIYYYGNIKNANKPVSTNLYTVETPVLTYQTDYESNTVTVSWDTDDNATGYQAEIFANDVKLTDGYDLTDINNGKLIITNKDTDSHYSSVYKVYITGIGNDDESYDDSKIAEIIIDNTAITGTGTENDPYIIRSGKQFSSIFSSSATESDLAANENIWFKQADDITLKNYTPKDITVVCKYDGNGNSINIESYVSSGNNQNGLFYALGSATISNLTLKGTIDGGTKTYTGGIAAYVNGGSIVNCINEATVKGGDRVGGIAGHIQSGSVINCINTGAIEGSKGSVGGIAGQTEGSGAKAITSCANYAAVTSTNTGVINSIGGILGTCGGTNITITKSFNAGEIISLNGNAGAIIGVNNSVKNTAVEVSDCFNTGKITAANGSGLILGAYIAPKEGLTFTITADKFYDVSNYENPAVPAELPTSDLITNVLILGGEVTAQTIIGAYSENRNYECQSDDGYDYPNFAITDDVKVKYNYSLGGIIKVSDTEDGSYLNPWIIDNADEFVEYFGENSDGTKLSGYFVQTADIELPESYRPYGLNVEGSKKFLGTYDGKGHSIKISMESASTERIQFAGVFGKNAGTIKNLKVTGYINEPNGSYIGGIVGWNYGRIENCINEADIIASGTVGGIVGKQENDTLTGILSGCINTGDISGTGAGGIIGAVNSDMIIINCANYGKISGKSRIGGIVGNSVHELTITSCFNAGSVTSGNKAAGAMVGNNGTSKSAAIEITDCFNIGKITGNAYNNAFAIGTISTTSEYAFCFKFSNVYDISDPYINVVAEGTEYYYDNVYILGKNDTDAELIKEYFSKRDGWIIRDGYDYPQLVSIPYDESLISE